MFDFFVIQIDFEFIMLMSDQEFLVYIFLYGDRIRVKCFLE